MTLDTNPQLIKPWEKILEQRIKKSRLKHPECLRILANFKLFIAKIPDGQIWQQFHDLVVLASQDDGVVKITLSEWLKVARPFGDTFARMWDSFWNAGAA